MTMEDANYDKVMSAYWRSQAIHEYWCGLLSAIRQRARSEQDEDLNWFRQIFYTCKAILCMVFRRQLSHWRRDFISVAVFDEDHLGSCGGAYPDWYTSWNELVVGVGLFRGWWYDIYSDANC
jgi:hypothetical protein